MPNYILSRTSPPAQFYERKINLGYGVKVDTSDAPQPEPKKEKKMEDVKEVLDVAVDVPANANPVNGRVVVPDGNAGPTGASDKAEKAKEAPEANV